MSAHDLETPKEETRSKLNSSQKLECDNEDEDFAHLTTEEEPSDSEDVLEGKEPGEFTGRILVKSVSPSVCPSVALFHYSPIFACYRKKHFFRRWDR